MADKLTPPPPVGSDRFADWLFKLREKVNGLIAGTGTSVAVSNLSNTQAKDLTDGGDSALHYHAADRNRANHTGTQTTDTISDLEDFVQSRVATGQAASSGTDFLGAQVFVRGIQPTRLPDQGDIIIQQVFGA